MNQRHENRVQLDFSEEESSSKEEFFKASPFSVDTFQMCDGISVRRRFLSCAGEVPVGSNRNIIFKSEG
jgi:hypothetical protein